MTMANWKDPNVAASGFGTVGTADAAVDAGLRSYMLSVYNYMASGVLLTGIVALLFSRWDGAPALLFGPGPLTWVRSDEHTSELQSLMRISYAVFCLNQKNTQT